MSGEVCAYFDATTSGIVAQLLVSDGERSRESRKALLSNHFKMCGIALGEHPTVGVATVITLADCYISLPLSYAVDVICEAGATPSTEFRLVMKSIPGQILEEVRLNSFSFWFLTGIFLSFVQDYVCEKKFRKGLIKT